MHHPTDQSFHLAICKRTRPFMTTAFEKRGVRKRPHVTVEFVLERPNELRHAIPKPRHTHGLNPFSPGILIIGGHRKNLFEQHLRREVTPKAGDFRRPASPNHPLPPEAMAEPSP